MESMPRIMLSMSLIMVTETNYTFIQKFNVDNKISTNQRSARILTHNNVNVLCVKHPFLKEEHRRAL